MALTLTEGELYSTTDMKSKYAIDRLVKDSVLIEKLPFETLLGNSDTYDTITTDSGAAFYSVGDSWVESTPSLSQGTVVLRILGGDADIDNFLLSTRQNKMDMKKTVLDNKIKAVRYTFLDNFFYGTGTAPYFSGLHVLMTSTTYNTVHAGSGTGSALGVLKLQEAIDLVPTSWANDIACLAMTKTMRRYINVYLDSIGDKFVTERDNYGKLIEYFRGFRIVVDDHISNAETAASGAYVAKTGGANTSIFVLTFASDAVCGVQGSEGLKVVPLGDLETKDAQRYRVKWYCGLKLKDIRSSAKVDGIVAAGTVTA